MQGVMMEGMLSRLFDVVESNDVRVTNERILLFTPTFGAAALRDALDGIHGQRPILRGTISHALTKGELAEVDKFEILLIVNSVARVPVARSDGSSRLYPDWRFYGIGSRIKREDVPIVGYFRTQRSSGAPNLCLVIPMTRTHTLRFVGEWTGETAALLRYLARLSVREFAKHVGVGPRMVSKWEAGGARLVPTARSQEKLDTVYMTLTVERRTAFGRIIDAAARDSRPLLAVAREYFVYVSE